MGAKCWIVGGTGGEGPERFKVYGMNRSGRRIEAWKPRKRFTNFRVAWKPDYITCRYPYGNYMFEGTREEMEALADELNAALPPRKQNDG